MKSLALQKKSFLFILISFFLNAEIMVFGQGPILNSQKYGYYKNRFNAKFISVGPNQGQSIPLWSRSSWGGPFANEFSFGDATLNLGTYIGVLSTEYLLLKQYNKSYSQTLVELFYALSALNRLDYEAEFVFQNKPNFSAGELIPSLTTAEINNNLNGFLLRDDVPTGFLDNKPNLKEADGFSNIQVNFARGDYIQNFNGPTNSFNNELSKDQIFSILEGLVIGLKCFENDDEIAPNNLVFVDGEITFRNELKAIGRRILLNLIANNYLIYNPITQQCAVTGGGNNIDNSPCLIGKASNLIEYAYPLAQIGTQWFDLSLSDFLNPTCIPGKPALTTMRNLWQIVATPEYYNLANQLSDIGNESKMAWKMGSLTDSWFLAGPISPFLSYTLIGLPTLGNLFQTLSTDWATPSESSNLNSIFNGYPCLPAGELLMLPNNLSTTEAVIKTNSHDLSHTEISYLIYCFVNGKIADYNYSSTIYGSTFDFLNLLDLAPCQGPYNYFNNDSINHPPPTGMNWIPDKHWSTTNRWDNWFDYRFTDSSIDNDKYAKLDQTRAGEYCGLDYMLLFNLVCLTNSTYISNYGNWQESLNISGQFPTLNNNVQIGSNSNPGFSFSFNTIEADAHLLNNSWIEAKSSSEIILKNGFRVEIGGYFSGTIGMATCPNGIYKNLSNENPPSNSITLAINGSEVSTPKINSKSYLENNNQSNSNDYFVLKQVKLFLEITPNPSKEFFIIKKSQTRLDSKYFIRMLNINGIEIAEINFNNNNEIEITNSNYNISKGVYIVQFFENDLLLSSQKMVVIE